MTVETAQILTTETIPAYLGARLNELKGVVDSVDAIVSVEAIQGGNVNYAFCISLDDNNRKIFLKQAPEFVAIFGPNGFPLTSERMQREMDVYEEWRCLLTEDKADVAAMLPDIYYFDKLHMVVIMEFLDGMELLDHVLVEHAGDYHPDIATNLGQFMALTHARTLSTRLSQDRIEYLTNHFENREMRDIQLEFVFSKCYKEANDEQRAGLQLTPAFMKEIEELKQQYNGNCPYKVLTHGDFHPGSVMVNSQGKTKAIDPEFTVFGPPGLDVGSLLSGYCLAAIHQAFSKNPTAVQRIVDGAQAVWDSYSRAMKDEADLDDAAMWQLEVESVGFCVAEVCRTALGFAGGRLWLQFPNDETSQKAACRAAMKVVGTCMVGRHQGGVQLLLDQMKAVALEE